MNSDANLLVAFVSGVLTFVSPCVLPLIPGYISYITGLSLEELKTSSKNNSINIALNTLFFIIGFTVVFTLLGASATYLGNAISSYKDILRWVGGIIIIVFGLHIAGISPIKFLYVQKSMEIKRKPKGYIGSDVFARMRRMQGFNVLHPMGYDAFGLPAEQYALEHNIAPQKAVIENVKTFERQLNKIGLSYDWDRKVNTTDPDFYRWTQWIFLKLFGSWYGSTGSPQATQKARPISELIKIFEKDGNQKVNSVSGKVQVFSASDWKAMDEKTKQDVLMKYRLDSGRIKTTMMLRRMLKRLKNPCR